MSEIRTSFTFMKTIDIERLIESGPLSKKELAKQLFPNNNHPDLALNRVIKKISFLDEEQISKLSTIYDKSISELFEEKEWKTEIKKNVYTFTCNQYTAELNTETNITKIYSNKNLFHESVIFPKATPLTEYLKEIESLILKYENDKD